MDISAAYTKGVTEILPQAATTLLEFHRLLENNELTRKIFETINGHLAAPGLMMREGTIVDATLIASLPSTKNKHKKRDPEMHQSKACSKRTTFGPAG